MLAADHQRALRVRARYEQTILVVEYDARQVAESLLFWMVRTICWLQTVLIQPATWCTCRNCDIEALQPNPTLQGMMDQDNGSPGVCSAASKPQGSLLRQDYVSSRYRLRREGVLMMRISHGREHLQDLVLAVVAFPGLSPCMPRSIGSSISRRLCGNSWDVSWRYTCLCRYVVIDQYSYLPRPEINEQ